MSKIEDKGDRVELISGEKCNISIDSDGLLLIDCDEKKMTLDSGQVRLMAGISELVQNHMESTTPAPEPKPKSE